MCVLLSFARFKDLKSGGAYDFFICGIVPDAFEVTILSLCKQFYSQVLIALKHIKYQTY